ncbi:uncharacterized protein N7459_003661 [Penicillium hispanicum]|uniref:uncharacterized protein n=1 Tax=Penicillium hispanicum TaxID=1080232 RepID=UPI002540411C|nr:uncharacterized protein N7459_003661 [Penicillium hispanicum]KAJ5587896.1 hypothetical protein N7459_003661 [Penicillium hispanicum]
MGRPPKKRARADEGAEFSTQQSNDFWPTPEHTTPGSFSVAPDPTAATDAQHLCPQLFWQSTRHSPSSQSMSDLLLTGGGNRDSIGCSDRLKNPNLPVPSSSSPWPDFSTVSESSAMPFPVPTNFPEMPSFPITTTSVCSSETPSPRCACLSYLYLCLSHISSIASFPVNSHTLGSLYIAARTAQDVIRCEACPKDFATGVQNIMFTGTLLTVIADAWLRVYNSDAAELGIQSAPPEFVSHVLQSADPAQAWNDWLRQIVRRAVIGGPFGTEAEIRCSNQRDLLSLINEVENRQRRWHEPGQHPLHHNPLSPSHPKEPCDEKELFCLRIVGSARAVLSKFNFEPSEFPDGIVPDDLRSKPV